MKEYIDTLEQRINEFIEKIEESGEVTIEDEGTLHELNESLSECAGTDTETVIRVNYLLGRLEDLRNENEFFDEEAEIRFMFPNEEDLEDYDAEDIF